MMRRGPLADYPIETLLVEAARERSNGILVFRSTLDGMVYFVDGEIYMAEIEGQAPLDQRLVLAGLLTQSQVDQHGVPGDTGIYLSRALDTDVTIDEDAIDAYLLDVSAAAIARFVGLTEGEFELDPYGAHPAGVLTSWSPAEVLARVEELREEAARREAERIEAERVEAERREAERVEAERVEAERREVERVEAARQEAEEVELRRIEAERRESERRAAELAAAQQDAVSSEGAGTIADWDGEADAGESADDQNPTADLDAPELSWGTSPVRPSPLFDALAANSVPLEQRSEGGLGELGPGVLVVVPEDPPAGFDSIVLQTVEWRVVVRAAQGDSIGSIANRLGLTVDETRTVVEGLWCRGLVATIDPGSHGIS